MNEFDILTILKEHNGSIEYVDLLNIGRTGQAHDTLTHEDLIKKLLKDAVLAGTADAYGMIRFGPKGRLRLQQLEELRQKESEYAAQATKEKRKQFYRDLLIAVVSAAVGGLIAILFK